MFAYRLNTMIKNLQDEPSTLGKKAILEVYKEDSEIIRYLNYVYDEVDYVYGKSKLPIIATTQATIQDEDLTELYALVEDMNDGELKGKAADEAMQAYCISKFRMYEELLFYIIKRDIKAKIGVKLINEVMGRVISVAPYMRCESESYMSKRIIYKTDDNKHGALAQSKADGAFFNVNVLSSGVNCTTRYGREVPTNEFLSSFARIDSSPTNMVLHGELLLKYPNGEIMERQIGNGRINAYMKRESTYKELRKKLSNAKTEKAIEKATLKMQEHVDDWSYTSKNLVYEIWDIVPFNDWIDLKSSEATIDRFNKVKEFVKQYNYEVGAVNGLENCELRLIDHKIVYSDEEAMHFYQDQLDAGLEGMVIKNLNAPWCHDTNREGMIKLKDFKENDLIIIGYNMADEDSEFVGGIGSLMMESSDGLLKVDVSGMKRHERGLERVDLNDSSKGLQVIEDFDFRQYLGKIAAVKYNEVIKSKSSDTHSLFLPTILEIRERSDKTQADDFNKIKKDAKYKG